MVLRISHYGIQTIIKFGISSRILDSAFPPVKGLDTYPRCRSWRKPTGTVYKKCYTSRCFKRLPLIHFMCVSLQVGIPVTACNCEPHRGHPFYLSRWFLSCMNSSHDSSLPDRFDRFPGTFTTRTTSILDKDKRTRSNMIGFSYLHRPKSELRHFARRFR